MSRSRSTSWRRFVVTTLLWSLALLLLTNVAWSWWFAQYGRMNGELMWMIEMKPSQESFGVSLDPANPEALNVVYRRDLDVQTRYWLFRSDNEEGLRSAEVAAKREQRIGSFEAVAPWWLRRRHARYPGVGTEGGTYAGEVSVTVGWPARLLWCSWRIEGTDFVVMRDTGISIEKPTGPVPSGFMGLKIKETYSRALPFRPVFSGQIVVFAGCLALTATFGFVVRAVNRSIRIRLGRCANCAYNLRGNTSGVCPECGASVNGEGAGG